MHLQSSKASLLHCDTSSLKEACSTVTSLGWGYNKQQNLLVSGCSTTISNQRSYNPISSSFYYLTHYILQNNLMPSRNGILYHEKYGRTTVISSPTPYYKSFAWFHSWGRGQGKQTNKQKFIIILANSIKYIIVSYSWKIWSKFLYLSIGMHISASFGVSKVQQFTAWLNTKSSDGCAYDRHLSFKLLSRFTNVFEWHLKNISGG